MEVVPDLVFLNCCHLAQTGPADVAYNRLAQSVARELIEIGVRCVIAAGWAVDDDAAYTFAETFYRALLEDRLQFGDAVFESRGETYRRHGGSITWGAYQAYGDPGWRVDPHAESSSPGHATARLVALEELIDQIERIRLGVYRRGEALPEPDAKRIVAQLKQLLDRCPGSWLEQPAVGLELARTYALLGPSYFEDAHRHYLAAVASVDTSERVPITAIEQLANIESRLGEKRDAPELVDRAIERLESLTKLAGAPDGAPLDEAATKTTRAHVERQSLVGAAYKRKAVIYARRILEARPGRESIEGFKDAVERAIAAYKRASDATKDQRLDPYPALNRLALQALDGSYRAGIAECVTCAQSANERFRESPDVWHAIMAAEAHLVESLCRGGLSGDDAASEETFERLKRRYAGALAHLQVAPKDFDSVAQQLCLLALLFEANGASRPRAGRAHAAGATAARLRRLANSILPGSCTAPAPRPARKRNSKRRRR
jgi:hypothetical protein